MAYRKLDRQPPARTGDAEIDARSTHDYLVYLYEQYNWLVSLLNRREQESGE